jgi:alanine dehydrogenase
MGAAVTVLDIDPLRLTALEEHYGNRIQTLAANSQTIEEEVPHADLLIGAVLVAGARAPRLVPRELVARMEPGSVIVDVAVDQGGCVATIRPTTHAAPVYLAEGVLHYGVANMPGAVSRTSTYALTNRTLPYVRRLASAGLAACLTSPELHAGAVTHPAVAAALGLLCRPLAG